MKILNLTKYGALVLVEFTGQSDRLISSHEPKLDISFPGNSNPGMYIMLGSIAYTLENITDLKVAGVAATDKADALAKLATVFPDASSGTGSTTGSEVAPFDYTASGDETSINSGLTNKSLLFAVRGSNVLKIITSGVPTPMQVLYNVSTGVLTFGAMLGSNEYVFILYKSTL